ncbi:MAG: hypothetical protein QW112_01465, partial [Candidatus Micrarchaeia archaeon]
MNSQQKTKQNRNLYMLHKRYGTSIRNRSLILDPEAEDVLRRAERQGNERSSWRRSNISEKKEIIRLLRGRSLSAPELFATLGMRNGFSTSSMLPYVLALKSLERKGLVRPAWAAWTYPAVKGDLLVKLEVLLLEKPRVYSSEDIVIDLGLLGEDYALKRVNKACNILEIAGRILKLPPSTMGKSNISMWIHSDYSKNPATVPSWNIKWWILRILMDGDATFSTLAMKLDQMGVATAFTREVGSSVLLASGIRSSIDSLREVGLVDVRQETVGHRMTRIFSLAEGVTELIRKPYLDETLNRALKAEYTYGMKLRINDMADKMLRCVRILMEHRRTGGKAFKVARTLGEKESYVEGVLRGSYP